MKLVPLALVLLLCVAGQDATTVDDASDLKSLTIGTCRYGTPVDPVDLTGKVVVWRTWSG